MPSRECCLNERGTIRACAAVKLVVSCSPKEDVAAGSGGRVVAEAPETLGRETNAVYHNKKPQRVG